MTRLLRTSLMIAVVCIGMAASPSRSVAATDDTQAVLQADRALEHALEKGDPAVVARMIDANFTWTDSTGKTSTRAQVLQNVESGKAPKIAVSSDNPQIAGYTYGRVSVIEASSRRLHSLRVWVKRPSGWVALIYQEVQALDAPPTVTPGPGKDCVNPCKSVPYQPKNATEKGVIEAYMGLETAAMAHNANAWSAYVADEFAAASSNSNEFLGKKARMEGLEREKMAGVSPTALVSARMFVFGETVVMTSLHRPDHGKPLQITRVWVKRHGDWLETLSYQTAIQDAPTVASN
jgi:hypothetical protein